MTSFRKARSRRQISEEDNVHRWLVSYADYMTLLFALFVVLYAMAMVNEKPFETITESIGRVFQAEKQQPKNRGQGDDVLPVQQTQTNKRLYGNSILEKTGPKLTDGNETLSNVSDSAIGSNLESLETQLHEALFDLIESGFAQLHSDGDWLEIRLNSGLLFPSGSASPTNSAITILTSIQEIISTASNFVRVRGYTDNQTINTEIFSSNWELSVTRATAILRELEKLSINPARMAIEGYGQYYPIADNSTDDGRSQNRRVVLAISKFGLKEKTAENEKIETEATEPEEKSTTEKNTVPNAQNQNTIKTLKLETGGIRITTRNENE